MDTAAPRAAGRREWIGLAVLALPTMLVSLDISVLFLALPHLAADLGASATEQLWITDIYGFLIAGFLVTMGTLGDRIGRRKLLLIGATGFGAASVLAAFSGSPEMLIVSRAILGFAGATLLPSTLALISTMFQVPRQMGVAMAIWGTAFMAGVALGPVVGGILLSVFWWGSVFLMAVPLLAILLIAGPLLLPESRAPESGRIDLGSVALSLLAILPLVYGLKELTRTGAGVVLPIVAIVIGATAATLFVLRQRRLEDPLLDLKLFRNRQLSAAVLIGLIVGAVQSGTGLYIALYLQTVEGFGPLQAGLWLLVPNAALVIGINVSPKLAQRFRPGYVLAAGLAVSAVGQFLLTQVDSADGLALLVIGVSVGYLGVGPASALLNHLVMDSTPPEKAGSAASLSATGGELGVAGGIAVFGSIGAAVYGSTLLIPDGVPAPAAGAAEESISGAVTVAGELEPAVGASLLDSAREAFTSGLTTIAGLSVFLFLALGALAAFLLRNVRPVEHEEAGTETGDEVEAGQSPDSVPTRG
ncbi:MFS transporter, DHA2 family, multidrug resistance protein [Amycolatopsis lurida]|uniref:MFS transporter n=1 Tax=Amycolatopsis lurida NRRL 2430 TaxID=1460371 RepID=A0A2P2FF79_AMYLU|nr:MFS transporter [Amycolatopsis lurida]KFU75376.1 MFS transporter [Amycolatopsis lurida NRRL 2430]SEE45398.1 MFS transporter, DHA2 family, multidrug resistance protein [Amycolatopsis lurida]